MPRSRIACLANELAEHEQPAPEAREAEQHAERARAAATIGDRSARLNALGRDEAANIGDRVWRAIEETPNFWTTLKPLENGAISAAAIS